VGGWGAGGLGGWGLGAGVRVWGVCEQAGVIGVSDGRLATDVASWRPQVLGEDPFRRSPVVALLPCVRLDNPHNFKLFQATLCEVGRPREGKGWARGEDRYRNSSCSASNGRGG
jgi:hypothetical protein